MKAEGRVIQWGLLSTAKINGMLIPSIRHSRNNTLSAVASRSAAKAREYAKKWKIPRAYDSYEALLNAEDIDIVYISLPNHLHAEWTIKALQAGKHVLCEKPLALNTDEVDAILLATQKTGKLAAEAFMYRHHMQTQKVKEIIDSGKIGQVKFMRGSFSFILDDPDNIRWNKEYGGGSLWDVGCYPISYFRMLTGSPPERVTGWQEKSSSGVDLSTFGMLQYPDNVIAQFDCSFGMTTHTSMEIRGSEGKLLIPDPFRILKKSSIFLISGSKEKEIKIPRQDLYMGEVEDLAASIAGNHLPAIHLQETRDNIATLNELYQQSLSY